MRCRPLWAVLRLTSTQAPCPGVELGGGHPDHFTGPGPRPAEGQRHRHSRLRTRFGATGVWAGGLVPGCPNPPVETSILFLLPVVRFCLPNEFLEHLVDGLGVIRYRRGEHADLAIADHALVVQHEDRRRAEEVPGAADGAQPP